MIRQNLGGTWEMRNIKEKDFLPAAVPGSVYHDLLEAGRMEDPYWRDNELKALKLMDEDYEYRTSFIPEPEILSSERAILRFHGIDTIADIFLNEELLGHVENMHRTWDYEVLDLLRPEENELRIVLYSPTKYIKEAYRENPADGVTRILGEPYDVSFYPRAGHGSDGATVSSGCFGSGSDVGTSVGAGTAASSAAS